MAEPTGIFIEFETTEANLKKLLSKPFEKALYGKKLGYYLCELLYQSTKEPASVFLFNYNDKTQTCYLAYMHRYIENQVLNSFMEILPIIADLKKPDTTNYAIVATTYPEVLDAYQLAQGKVTKFKKTLQENLVKLLMDTFWSFSVNGSFPEPKKALNKRNYFYKNFKNYYKKFLSHIELIEKPSKIANATKENPYHLLDKLYTYDHKVFEFRTFTNQIILLPDADPLTIRNVSGIYADKNNVYLSRLSPNSPPNINPRTGNGNNPNAIWEYYTVPGIDGSTFNYVKEKWDTIYWKDRNSVFIFDREARELQTIPNADSKTFEYLDFCYGRDKNQLFYLNKALPVDVNKYNLNKNGFIFDSQHVFHYQHKLRLDAMTFKVIEYESEVNSFLGTFLLEDKNGSYKYNRNWENPLMPLK